MKWKRKLEKLIKEQGYWVAQIFKYALDKVIEWYQTGVVPKGFEIKKNEVLSDLDKGVQIYNLQFMFNGETFKGYVEIKKDFDNPNYVWVSVLEKLSSYGMGRKVSKSNVIR